MPKSHNFAFFIMKNWTFDTPMYHCVVWTLEKLIILLCNVLLLLSLVVRVMGGILTFILGAKVYIPSTINICHLGR